MKRLMLFFTMLVLTISLSGCWNEVVRPDPTAWKDYYNSPAWTSAGAESQKLVVFEKSPNAPEMKFVGVEKITIYAPLGGNEDRVYPQAPKAPIETLFGVTADSITTVATVLGVPWIGGHYITKAIDSVVGGVGDKNYTDSFNGDYRNNPVTEVTTTATSAVDSAGAFSPVNTETETSAITETSTVESGDFRNNADIDQSSKDGDCRENEGGCQNVTNPAL